MKPSGSGRQRPATRRWRAGWLRFRLNAMEAASACHYAAQIAAARPEDTAWAREGLIAEQVLQEEHAAWGK